MLITSNVFNLIDWSENGVEPCIGSYIHNVVLTDLFANCLQGPNFAVAIRFNQYSRVNEGFGTGWELNLSCVETHSGRRLLRLTKGARYWIEEQSGEMPAEGRLLMLQDKYHATFYCKEFPGNKLCIYYKNGIQEELQDGRTTKIHSLNGHAITLVWQDDRLSRIDDENGEILLSLDYSEIGTQHFVEVTHARRTDIYTLKQQDNCWELSSVTIKSGSPLGGNILYTFSYQHYNQDYLLISELTSPINDNRHEVIRYADVARPAGLTQVIKAVDKLSLYRTATQYDEIEYHFADEHNFLGVGSDGVSQWQPLVDNMKSLGVYQFTRVEKLGAKEIQRRYHCYYLLLKQSITPTDSSQQQRGTATEYGYQFDDPEKPGDVWPAYFLPVSVTRYGWEKGIEGLKAQETCRFDRYGNQLESLTPDGIKIKHCYYNGQQDTADCPKDPYGFDNYLKQRCIIPADSDIGYEKRENWRYQQITGSQLIVPKERECSQFIQLTEQSELYEHYFYTYNTEKATLGELINERCLRYPRDEEGELGEALEQNTSYGLHVDTTAKTFTRTLTFTGTELKNDQGTQTGKHITHYLTGDNREQIDNVGRITRKTFDELGRLVSRTLQADSEQPRTETLFYFSGYVERTLSHNPGLRWRFIHNQRGHLTEERVKVGSNDWVTTILYTLDAHGRVTKLQEYDYREKPARRIISAETENSWDYQDNLVASTSSYQSPQQIVYDYAKRTKTTEGPAGELLFEESDAAGRISRKTFSAKDETLGHKEKYTYNGLGLRASMELSDSTGTITYTEWQYDVYGRVSTENVTANGKTRTKKHAYDGRFSEEKVTSSYLNQRRIEGNEYDVLGRLSAVQKDNAWMDLTYPPESSFDQPQKVTVLQGRVFDYLYYHDGQIKQQTLAAAMAPHQSWQRNFGINTTTGAASEAISQQSFEGGPVRTLTENYTYSDGFGFLEHCKISWKHKMGSQPEVKDEESTIEYQTSLSGRLLSAGNAEYREYYRYNLSGFLESVWYVVDGKVQCRCRLRYDSKQRLQELALETRLEDASGRNRSLFTDLIYTYDYDKFGRVLEIDYSARSTVFLMPSLLNIRFSYDSQQNITQLDGNLIAPPKLVGNRYIDSEKWWSEERIYNGYGELVSWDHKGDLQLVDRQGFIIQGQSFHYKADGLIDYCVTRFDRGPEDTMQYLYGTGSAQISLVTHSPAGHDYPEEETYYWNKEGQLSSRSRSDGYRETYHYGGEQNVAAIDTLYPGQGENKKNLIYDANNRLVMQIEQQIAPGQKEPATYQRIHDIYGKDQHMIRRVFNQETATTPEMVIYFHRLFDQVIGVSVRENSGENAGKVVTGFHLNQPDGTPMAKCFQVHRDRRVALAFPQAYALEVQWVGQNAQGFIYEPLTSYLQLYSVERQLAPPAD
ncbi:hypothetical protein [Enterobacter mori]|uniref:hypothetical protein n=1 Tax=Enterobacter mori TaxID=539813 RepID=UPI001B8B5B7D|nr:hypothetical protein [Enterobacter mori]MBS3049638.1 hypothetical protein [Enterobacter mori]